MFGDRLEKLLKIVFEDSDKSTLDIEILSGSILLPKLFSACRTYSYGGYDG